MHFKELDRGEVIAVAGGVLLIISLFLDWYTLGNEHTTLSACKGAGTGCTAWRGVPVLSYILVVAAVAPIILAWIIVRGHALAWPRGELTALVALVTLILILFFGVIDKPGNPRSEISIAIGWYLALIAGILIFVGALWRTSESQTPRKPPGVL